MLRSSARYEHFTGNTVPLSLKHTSIYSLKDNPEQFAVVAFDEHIERITSALYLDEPSLRIALSPKLPAKEIERRIQAAKQNPV